MTMLNQAAVEALCSATYLENYLDTMDNLPDDLQRVVTQMRELDIQCKGKFQFLVFMCSFKFYYEFQINHVFEQRVTVLGYPLEYSVSTSGSHI